jgi:DNA invertase Pin-like site-specific DNA recombinase
MKQEDYDILESEYTALIGCRVSGRKQLKGSGLDSQEHRCRQHAAMRGYPVEKVFLADVSGGLDLSERREIQELLAYLDSHRNNGKHYVVIFDDHKRFARNTAVHLHLRRELATRGARIEYLNYTIEDTPEGTFFETLLAAQAQLEREQNGRQTRQKTKARLEKGFWAFPAPMGYKYVPSKHGGKELTRVEPLASVIAEALEGYASGLFATASEMRHFLEQNPHFPKDLPDGGVRKQTVARLLDQVLYAGYLEAPTHNVSLRKANHLPLISLATYEKIQERRKNNSKLAVRKDIHRDFVLRGAICCHACETPLRSGWSKGKNKYYAYYLCQTKECPEYGKSIARDQIEGKFVELLQTMQPSRGAFQMICAMFKDAWKIQSEKTLAAANIFKKEAQDAEKEIGQLIERIMEASNPRVIQAYENKIDALEKRKLLAEEKAVQTLPSKHRFNEMLELSLLFLANPYKLWKNGAFELKRTTLKLAFTGPILYNRNPEARTPLKALPHKAFHIFVGNALQDGAGGGT